MDFNILIHRYGPINKLTSYLSASRRVQHVLGAFNSRRGFPVRTDAARRSCTMLDIWGGRWGEN